jgi:hypothetical protein
MDLAFQVNFVVDGVGYPLSFEEFVDNDRIRYEAKLKSPQLAEKMRDALNCKGICALLCCKTDQQNGYHYAIEIDSIGMGTLKDIFATNNNWLVQLRGFVGTLKNICATSLSR